MVLIDKYDEGMVQFEIYLKENKRRVDAIAEARKALEKDPHQDPFVQLHLLRTLYTLELRESQYNELSEV